MADTAVAADDVVISEFTDATFQFFPPKDLAQLPFKCELDEAAEGIGDNPCPADDQDDGKDLAFGTELVDFPETDRGQGNDGHVEGVKGLPVLDQGVAKGAESYD
jgi:hypothetical protein